MDEIQIPCSDTNSPAFDEVVLSDRAFDTDPTKVLVESSDPDKLRFRLIEWLAESPHRKVKAERKQEVQRILGFKSVRQVERLLEKYYEEKLSETAGVQRSDKGQHRIDEY